MTKKTLFLQDKVEANPEGHMEKPESGSRAGTRTGTGAGTGTGT